MLLLLAWQALGAGAEAGVPKWRYSVTPGLGGKQPTLTVEGWETAPTVGLIDDATSTTLGQDVVVDAGRLVATPHAFAQITHARWEWRGLDSTATSTSVLLLPEGASIEEYEGIGNPPEPDDFDAYWERALAELDTIGGEAELTLLADRSTTTGWLFRVVLPATGDTKIVCFYTVPRTLYDPRAGWLPGGKIPGMAIFPGYGAAEPPIDRTRDGIATLSVNPRNHGPSRQYWTSPVNHLAWNIENPDEYYYRYAMQDALLATRWLLSRPEIDDKRVAVEGGSQGGWFAVVAAAWEPRVACALSNVTAFSGFGDAMLLGTTGHHTQYRQMLAEAENDPAKLEAIRRSMGMTDGANHAARVRCPIQFVMGGIDGVCPYPVGYVLANRLPTDTPREVQVLPGVGHAVPGDARMANAAWLAKSLGLSEIPWLPGEVLPVPEQ